MRKLSIIITVLLFSINQVFAGGGWTHEKGKGYLKLSEWWVISNQHFTDNGEIDPNVTNALYSTAIYGEYGLTDALDVQLFFPFFSRAVINEVKTASGTVTQQGDAINTIGDTDIGLKYGLIRDRRFVLSTYLWLGIPLGNDQGGVNGNLQTGDGEFNQRIGFDCSTSIQFGGQNQFNAFFSLGASYNFRSNGFSDQVRADGEAGVSINDKWILVCKLISLNSTFNGTKVNSEGGGLFVNDIEYNSFALEGAYKLNQKLGVSASFEGAFSGSLVYANPAYSIGIFLNL